MGLVGKYEKGETNEKDFAFIPLKYLKNRDSRELKGLLLKPADSQDIGKNVYLTGNLTVDGVKQLKTITNCSLTETYNTYNNSYIVTHDCPTTPGTSGASLVISDENGDLAVISVHKATNKVSHTKKAVSFNENLIKNINSSMDKIESCFGEINSKIRYLKCLGLK